MHHMQIVTENKCHVCKKPFSLNDMFLWGKFEIINPITLTSVIIVAKVCNTHSVNGLQIVPYAFEDGEDE